MCVSQYLLLGLSQVRVQESDRPSNTVFNNLQTSAEIAYQKGGGKRGWQRPCAWRQLKARSTASWFEAQCQNDTVDLSNVQIYDMQSVHNLLVLKWGSLHLHLAQWQLCSSLYMYQFPHWPWTVLFTFSPPCFETQYKPLHILHGIRDKAIKHRGRWWASLEINMPPHSARWEESIPLPHLHQENWGEN